MILYFPVFLQQEPEREVEAEKVVIVDPVIIMGVHHQRTTELARHPQLQVLQVGAVGNVPLFFQVFLRLVDLYLVPLGKLPGEDSFICACSG